MHLFCFGLGHTSQTLSQALLAKGYRISGTCRSHEKQRELKKGGIQSYLLQDVTPNILSTATHILISIPPFEDTGDIVLEYFKSALQDTPNIQWIGYLSTVGVYGDHDGGWVNEGTLCKPVSQRSVERLVAETAWQEYAAKADVPLAILRLSGIYGPGQNQLEKLKRLQRWVRTG